MKDLIARFTALVFLIILSVALHAQNKSLDLSAAGNRLEISSNLNTGGFTVEHWVYLNNQTQNHGLINQTTTNLPSPLDVYVNITGDLNVLWGNNSNIGSGTHYNGMVPNEWIHVAITYDPASTGTEGKVFVNGTQVTTYSVAGIGNGVNPIMIGNRADAATEADALIDQLRIWNDVRTPAEIQSNYMNGIASPISEPNLVGYYDFDDNLLDASSSSLNATQIGTIAYSTNAPAPFVTTWSTSDGTITIPTNFGTYTYDYNVTWKNLTNATQGDGSISGQTGDYLISGLNNSDIYEVSIMGNFPAIYFINGPEASKILTVEQWGSIAWQDFTDAFNGCLNLIVPAIDAPDLTLTTSLSAMFQDCASLTTEDFSGWDITPITDLNGTFKRATNFDGNVSNWNVTNVTDMLELFRQTSFNQNISGWNVGLVTRTNHMFNGTPFNQPIGSWVFTTQLTDMTGMFSGATAFNQDISGWDVSFVTDMSNMFNGVSTFDQSLGAWDVQSVVDMTDMLSGSGLSTANYDATLVGWSGQGALQTGVNLGVTGLVYSATGQTGRDVLTAGPNSWIITGDGLESSPPSIALGTVQNTTSCITPDGSIELTGLDPFTVYDIFYDENATPTSQLGISTDGAGNLYMTGLFSGNYENITVEIPASGNPSNVIFGPVTIIDPVPPVITPGLVSVLDESAPGANDGQIDATGSVSGGSGSYQYEWFEDAGLTIPAGTGVSITGLFPGTYYLLVTDAISDCTATVESFVVNTTAAPSIALGIVQNTTSCITPDGSLELTGLDPFTIYDIFYDENATPTSQLGVLSDGVGNLVMLGLFAADYTNISAEVPASGNPSNVILGPVTITNPALPSFDDLSVIVNDESAPAAFDGVIDASGTASGGSGGPYTFNLYDDIFNPLVSNPSGTFTGLAPGTYYVDVTDDVSSCISSQFAFVVNTVAASAPLTQAINVNFANVTDTSVDINWLDGNGAARIVAVYQGDLGTAGFPLPNDNQTYAPSSVFGGGENINLSGWYVVARGAISSPLNITGLTPGLEYTVAVLEYNGTPGNEIYNTFSDSGNPNSFFTTGGGLANPAISFDGTSQWINLPATGDAFESTSLTVEAWVRPAGAEGYVLMSETLGGWGFYYSGGQLGVTNVGSSSIVSSISLPTGIWSHVAFTYSGGNISFYLNGSFIETVAFTLFTGSSNGDYTIGGRVATPQFGAVDIDELRIWDISKSGPEIQSTYDREVLNNEANLIGYYKFNENGGLGAFNSTGLGFDGVLFNGPTWVEGPSLFPATGGAPLILNFGVIDFFPTAITVSVNVDMSSTLYSVVTQSPTMPSIFQIQNGLDEFDGPAVTSGVFGVAPGFSNFGLGGLSPATNYYVYAVAENGGEFSNVVSDNFNTPGDPIITVISPNGGENIQLNSLSQIIWNAIDIVGDPNLVIEYSDDSGVSWFQIHTEFNSSLNGSYFWYVDQAFYTTGSNFKIRVRTEDSVAVDESDGIFNIVPAGAPSLTMVYPNGGEQFERGQSIEINYAFTGFSNTDELFLEYSADSGTNWNIIGSTQAGSAGSFYFYLDPLTVPVSTNYLVRVRNFDNTVSDQSDAVFNVISEPPPSIDFTNPGPGQPVEQNSIIPISLNLTNFFEYQEIIAIEVSENNGGSWTELVQRPVQDLFNGFNWFVSSAAFATGSNYLLRARTLDNSVIGTMPGTFQVVAPFSAPSIFIQNPSGQSSYYRGTTELIRFSTTGIPPTNQIQISWSIDGFTYNPIIQNTLANLPGEYSWVIDATYPESNNFTILIQDLGGSGASDTTDILSIVIPPKVTIASQVVTGGNVVQGSTNNLIYKFSALVEDKDTNTEGLYLLFDGDITPSDVDALSLSFNSVDDFGTASLLTIGEYPNVSFPDLPSNSILWLFNELISQGSTIFFYVTLDVNTSASVGTAFNISAPTEDNFGFGDGSKVIMNATAGSGFTIQAATPTITLTQPNGGELLNVGDNYPITWTNSGFPGTDVIEIQLSTNGGTTFNNIGTGTFDNYNGNFSWVVPNLVGSNNLIRVRNLTTVVSDVSNAVFTIQLPSVPTPTVQASVVDFTQIGIDQLEVAWSNGDGAERIVFMRSGTSAFPLPTNNVTYTASSVFGSGNSLASGWVAVYAGSNTNVIVTGLQPQTTYSVAVVEYNLDGLGQKSYLTTPATQNPNSAVTLALPNVSLDFDGVNDYVEIPYDAYLDLGNTFSIEAYVKSGATNSGFRSIIDKRNAGTNNSNFSMSVVNGTDIGVYINNGTINFFQTVPGVLQVGTWALLSVTYDGANVRVYANGIERAAYPLTMTYLNESVPIQIGRASFNDEYFNGEIDEVRIWTNVLTPANIGSKATKALVGNEFGLVAYYNFNDGIPGSNNSAVSSVNNSASVSSARPMDGVLNGFAKTGLTSNFVESTAFDFSVTRPTGQANSINISGVTTTTANISWAIGNGVKRIVAMRLTSVDDLPDLSDNVYYRSDVRYGRGDQTTDGWYIIYNGVGSSVTVTDLSPNAQYKVAVIEANGPAGAELYNLNTNIANPNTFTSAKITPNISITTIAVSASNVRQGKSNVLVYKFKMEVKDAPIDLASLSLNFAGTAQDADFAGLGGLKLYASVTGDNITNFNSAIPLATSSYNSGSPLWLVTKNYPTGTIVHYYVVASMDVAAVPARTFSLNAPLVGNFSFSSTPAPNMNFSAATAGSTYTIEQTPIVTLNSEIDVTVMRKRLTPGSTNNWVYKYNLVIDRDVRVTKVRIPFDGTLSSSDITSNGAKLWANTNSGITTPPTGTALATANVGISEIVFNIPSGDQLFIGPNTIQFWVSLDLATGARLSDTFQGAGTLSDFTFNDLVVRTGSPALGLKSTITQPDSYCDPTVNPISTTVGPTITNFTMPGINNSPQGDQDYHMFFLSNSAGVLSNTTQNVSITSSGSGFVKMWVDWDKNNAFNEATELVINNVSVSAGVPFNTTINIPATATAGNSRIRVYVYSTNEWINGGCNPLNGGITTAEGQIHDYGISIVEPNGPTQTLAASNIGYFNFTANWIAMPGANFYRIDIAEDPAFTKLLVNNVGVTTNSYSFNTGLKYDKNYYFRVRVAYPSVTAVNSNVTTVRTLRDPLTAQDSAALVLIYQTNGGNGWENATNWRQTGKRLATWAGVTMTDTRVTSLNMQGFGLTGDMPDAFNNAGALQLLTNWNLSQNKLTGIDLVGTLGSLANLNVMDNKLVFDDIEPNIGLFTAFDYVPQQEVGSSTEVIIPRGSNYTVSFIEQPADNFQWRRNGDIIPGAINTSLLVEDIKYETMGDFTLDMTDNDVPGLTLTSAKQTVLASGGITINVADLNGLPLEEGTGYLLKIEQPGEPFDTTVVANFTEGYLFFDITILGDYIISVHSDPATFLPTYYKQTFLWEEADTLFFRNVALFAEMTMTSTPGARDLNDTGKITGFMEIDDPTIPDARLEGRRRAPNVRCHIRRNTGGGRSEDGTYVLIASVVTDENGRFDIPNLAPGFYRINFEYPGVPMDKNSFVEFEVTAEGDNSTVDLFALAENGVCRVDRILPTGVRSLVEEIRIYPNPASQFLSVDYLQLLTNATISIINLNGREVSRTLMTKADSGSHKVDVSQLSAGIYILNVSEQDTGMLITSFKILIKK